MARTSGATLARTLVGTAIVVAVGLAIGVVLLWPPSQDARPDSHLAPDLVSATVIAIDPDGCAARRGVPSDGAAAECRRVTFELGDGTGAARTVVIDVHVRSAMLDVAEGDAVVLQALEAADGEATFAIYDRDRTAPLLWLAVTFSVLVVILGRLRGFAALLGLGLSLAILLLFVLPAILAGGSPALVACVGGGIITYAVIYLAHGFSLQTTVAVLGTVSGLVLAIALSLVWVPLARLTGLVTESSYVLQVTGARIDPEGLLLAGIVIGALGAIDDVSVTQASAIWELKAARRTATRSQLLRAGMRVGRDHVGSIVNTLALAYVGASLPLLIIFQLSTVSFERTLGSEIVATEIIRTLVGSIGLVAAVPLASWLAAMVASEVRPDPDASDAPPRVSRPTEPGWEEELAERTRPLQ